MAKANDCARCRPSRRQRFALAPQDEAANSRSSTQMIIDVFNHFMPAPYFARVRELVPTHAAATAFPRLRTLWDLDARLRLLDQFGAFQQVLSLANPPLEYLGTAAETPDLARMANDGLAE